MKWANLTEAQHTRLCECRSLRKDIVPIAKGYMLEDGYDPERALEITLEHLGSNNQFFDLSNEEWTDYLYELNVWDERRRDVI